MPQPDGTCAAVSPRVIGTTTGIRPHRSRASWLRALAVGAALAGMAGPAAAQTTTPVAPSTPAAAASPVPAGSEAEPRVPATNNAASPFRADRASSEPLGLFPNQTTDPFTYPAEPIVLNWSPVPGAVSYLVEVSTSPGFGTLVWKTTTDQVTAAPELLLPDGTYWWRIAAFDKAGTKGIVSSVATFAKEWPTQITGGVVSDSPLGAPASLIPLTPYLRWDPLPGAAGYQTEIASGDQFALPKFWSKNYPDTTMQPGSVMMLPDDSYAWRVRALDANVNPGRWVDMGSFTKAWKGVEITAPADGAQGHDFNLRWQPLSGAEKYQVQISEQQFVWQGDPLVANAVTAQPAYTPSNTEMLNSSMDPGTYYWRVRPVVNGVYGTWSTVRRYEWKSPASVATDTTPTLQPTPDSHDALSPTMAWSPVVGAHIYRVDVATDAQFNNVVHTTHTDATSWTPRLPLPDNQVREGYFWRVLAGTGFGEKNPGWMYDEGRAPVGKFRKQTQVTLGDAATGVVASPPMFTWGDVMGAARYELQVSRDTEFAEARTNHVITWSRGTAWIKDEAKRLGTGTWYWRVRAIDGAGEGQTWSPVSTFILNPPPVTPTAPNDGAAVIGSPLLTWQPQNGACLYQVQVADNPGFQTAATAAPVVGAGGGGNTSGGNTVTAADATGAIGTPQTGLVPTGAVVSHPGTWYWRVRIQYCGDDAYSGWSANRKFISVRPPNFNLNAFKTTVPYGTRQVISGRLVHNGVGVAKPVLIVERRVWPSGTFSAFGTVTGDASGRFAFTLPIKRTAAWRIRWAATAKNPEGLVPFVIRATPRIGFRTSRARVTRNGALKVTGSVFPRRPSQVQVREADGWRTIRTLNGKKARFSVVVRARVATGTRSVRLFVPRDKNRTLEAASSVRRTLLVFDRFVVKRGR